VTFFIKQWSGAVSRYFCKKWQISSCFILNISIHGFNFDLDKLFENFKDCLNDCISPLSTQISAISWQNEKWRRKLELTDKSTTNHRAHVKLSRWMYKSNTHRPEQCVSIHISLIFLLPFFFWPLFCLSFFALRPLITHSVCSNSSQKKKHYKIKSNKNACLKQNLWLGNMSSSKNKMDV